MNQARIFAFNTKYGNYDYNNDIRYKFEDWHKSISEKINDHFGKLSDLDILDVGGNNGSELFEIFNKEHFLIASLLRPKNAASK